jgi:hypothetical protein
MLERFLMTRLYALLAAIDASLVSRVSCLNNGEDGCDKFYYTKEMRLSAMADV